MTFSRQEYWSGLAFPSPGDLPDPGIEPTSPAPADGFFTRWAIGEAQLATRPQGTTQTFWIWVSLPMRRQLWAPSHGAAMRIRWTSGSKRLIESTSDSHGLGTPLLIPSSPSGPQPFWCQGSVLQKTIFPWTKDSGHGLGMIQVHYSYCALYFYYYYNSSTSDHQAFRFQRLGTPALDRPHGQWQKPRWVRPLFYVKMVSPGILTC